MYYARQIGYLKNGTMVDERGHTHRMPPGSRTFNFTIIIMTPLGNPLDMGLLTNILASCQHQSEHI